MVPFEKASKGIKGIRGDFLNKSLFFKGGGLY
jgi:hypothetical protein